MAILFDPPEGISLRVGQPEDYPFAEELYLATTGPLRSALGPWDKAVARERLGAELRGYPHQIICADGQEIGLLQVSISPAAIHLHQIHLRGDYRNRGIGTRLIRNILDHSRQTGLPVTLNVIRGNPAIALYERLGFEIVGTGVELLQMRWQPVDGKAAPEAAPLPPKPKLRRR